MSYFGYGCMFSMSYTYVLSHWESVSFETLWAPATCCFLSLVGTVIHCFSQKET